MNILEKYFKLLSVSHLTRISTGAVFLIIGALLGTNGLLEISSMSKFWDVIMWIGIGVIGIYTILLTILGIYKVLGFGYQPGDYNKWRDGDFEEWKKKNPKKRF